MELKTLADFKRALATPDATLTITHFVHTATGRPMEHKFANLNRPIVKVQTNAVAILSPVTIYSWLYFGNASDWVFNGNIACQVDEHAILVYRLNLPEEVSA